MGVATGTESAKGGVGGWIKAHRRGIAYALVGVACLLTLVVSMSVWVNRQLLDTNTWVDQSSKMLQNEDVRHALALRMVDAAYSRGDVEQRIEERLPAQLKGIAPQIAGALRPAAINTAESILETSAVQKLWEEANRRAHTRLVQVLEGNEGGVITTANGDVTLDLQQLVDQLRQQLGIQGTNVPAEGSSITIMHSNDLEAAQKAVRAIKVVSAISAIAIVALLALAVWMAEGARREVVRAAAWGILAVGLVLLVVRRLAGQAVIDSLSSPESQPAARQVYILATSVMRDIALGLVVLGLVGILYAFLAGGTRLGTRVRGWIAPTLRQRPALAFGAVVLVFGLLLLWGPIVSGRTTLGTLVLLLIAVGGTEALRRQVTAEAPGR